MEARNRLSKAHRAYLVALVKCWAHVRFLMGKEAVLVGWGKPGGKLADALAEISHVTHAGNVFHMETFCISQSPDPPSCGHLVPKNVVERSLLLVLQDH